MWADGAGFGCDGQPGSEFPSPTSGAPKKIRRIENILPLNICTILELDPNDPQYHGAAVSLVTVMGLINNVEKSVGKIIYSVYDTTGIINAIKWIDQENENDIDLLENTYCRVFGTFKSIQEGNMILVLHIEPITDFNWITAHIIEVYHSYFQLVRLKTEMVPTDTWKGGAALAGPGGFLSNSMVGYKGQEILSGDNEKNLNPAQKMVMEVINGSSMGCPGSGFSRNEIKRMLIGKLTPPQIDNVLFFLSSEGHIYSTEDEDHFKPTQC